MYDFDVFDEKGSTIIRKKSWNLDRAAARAHRPVSLSLLVCIIIC